MADKTISLRGITDLPPFDAEPDTLAPFLISILQEAVPFVDSVATPGPGEWKSKGKKTYADSVAPVEMFERVVVDDANIGGHAETWACRRSVHADEATKGSANWGEFRDGFKERHVEVEKAFTPSVVRTDEIGRWEAGGVVGLFFFSSPFVSRICSSPFSRETNKIAQGCRANTRAGGTRSWQNLWIIHSIDALDTSPHRQAHSKR